MNLRPRESQPKGCPYCGGHREHTEECVCVTRSVVIATTVEYVIEVPRNWDQHQIEFQRNEGSFCLDNDMEALAEVLEDGKPCTCGRGHSRYMREATMDDHKELPCLARDDFDPHS